MKTITSIITLVWCCTVYGASNTSDSYHFEEGFAGYQDMVDKSWTRNCAGSNSESLVRGGFGGTYVPKFDKDSNGESKDLISPEVDGAGLLSFWHKTNSTNNRLSLHICVVRNGISNEVKKLSYTEISKEWVKCSIDLNELVSESIKIRIWAEQEEDASAILVIDDISLSKYAANDQEITDRIQVNFADDVWGEAIERPASGSYPSSEINGFKFTSAALITGGRVAMDKQTMGGSINFPLLAGIEEIDIYANVGTEGNTFALQEYGNGNWTTVESIVGIKAGVTTHTIKSLGKTGPVNLRVANTSNGTINIYRIASRTSEDVANLSFLKSSIEDGSVCYYNLTKHIALIYNKVLAAGEGDIRLNDILIPVSSCTFRNDTVFVPVALSASPSGNTAYTLSVPEGAFTEYGNTGNVNAPVAVSFSTYKTVALPEGYASMTDVAYFDANSAQNRMDIYYPDSPDNPVPVVINIHGGGWNHGEKESQTGYNLYFNMGFAVANVEYRMTPQATAPAAIEDVRCAMMYLINNAADLNIDPTKIVLQGSSAGAHLAMTAAYLDQNNVFNPNCSTDKVYNIIAVIDKYGPSKLDDFMYYSSLTAWLGSYAGDEDFIRSVSPFCLADRQSAPTYIIHGDADPTVPYSQSAVMDSLLTAKQVKHHFTTVPGGGHGGFSAEYNTLMNEEIREFLLEILSYTSSLDKAKQSKTFRPVAKGNRIILTLDGATTGYLYDISGRLLYQTTAKEFVFERKGLLLLKVVAEDGIYHAKI